MALAKIDQVGTAIEAAGISLDSDQAMAIRELVEGGENLDAAIGEFAPSASAMVASQQAAVTTKKGRKTKSVATVDIPAQQQVNGAELETVQETAWESGVGRAHQLGRAARQSWAEGFAAQAGEEVAATNKMFQQCESSFAAIFGG